MREVENMTETKTIKQLLWNRGNGQYLHPDEVKPIIKEWLEQKPTIPKILCNQLCNNACKLCILDDALSKSELLEELKQ